MKSLRLLLAFWLSASGLQAADLAAQGREVFQKHQTAVITVQLVLKSKLSMPGMGNEGKESKVEVTGTVIDPSGLTVVSLFSTDPASGLQGMLAGLGGDDEDAKFKLETELTDVKLLCHDGAELPAEVVLRDKDLDLAFVRPKAKPASPLPALDLANAGAAQVLDEVISINRLGKVAGRAYAASIKHIQAVVQRPRLFYVPGSEATVTGLGCPAFTPEGKVLGLFVMRMVKSGGGGGMAMFDVSSRPMMPIIMPVESIRKTAQQAPPAKEPAK